MGDTKQHKAFFFKLDLKTTDAFNNILEVGGQDMIELQKAQNGFNHFKRADFGFE